MIGVWTRFRGIGYGNNLKYLTVYRLLCCAKWKKIWLFSRWASSWGFDQTILCRSLYPAISRYDNIFSFAVSYVSLHKLLYINAHLVSILVSMVSDA